MHTATHTQSTDDSASSLEPRFYPPTTILPHFSSILLLSSAIATLSSFEVLLKAIASKAALSASQLAQRLSFLVGSKR